MPSNQEIIAAVEDWQSADFFHPLTCGNKSSHSPLRAIEVNGKVILKCLDCDYTQNWIPDVIIKQYEDRI